MHEQVRANKTHYLKESERIDNHALTVYSHGIVPRYKQANSEVHGRIDPAWILTRTRLCE